MKTLLTVLLTSTLLGMSISAWADDSGAVLGDKQDSALEKATADQIKQQQTIGDQTKSLQPARLSPSRPEPTLPAPSGPTKRIIRRP